MIRILLVDDQKMVREALKAALAPETDLDVIGTANNGIAAIEQVAKLRPDVVVMNMEMPGLDGARATQHITSEFTDTKVLILTSYDTDEYITKSLAMGAKGYLLKNTGTKDIAGAIRNIHKGYTQISPGLLDKLLVCTDSGIVISKLQKTTSRRPPTIPTAKPQRTLSGLQLATRQQQEEISRLRDNLDRDRQELPQIKKNLSRHTKYLWLLGIMWLLCLPIITLLLWRVYNKTDAIQASVIPEERIGLRGEFSLNGIAQRVTKVFQEDPLLADISTVYVAQEDDAIILTGTISDPELLRHMENLAKEVNGVNKVYSSQVAIQSNLQRDLLGSQ